MLEGKAAIITGGAGGLGRSMAETFLRAGASVLLSDLNDVALREVVGELHSFGKVVHLAGDVSVEADVQRTVDRCVAEFGTVDILVNNAGITRDATMRKMPLSDFQAVLNVHLVGAWLGTRTAAAVMREKQSGSIINMSSISGKIGNVGQTNYSAAKAGMVGLTKASAKELAHLGVRVNAIQPGLIRTAMTAGLREDLWERKVAAIPMGRAGEPSEVADVALFLASDLSSYLTGAVLEVTGGRDM
ncbi:MAG TPA: 3-oxoacyl-ACP reductase FabG [Mycobacterium sp.]|jgi:3-oxoacyl-[acyl-carrier protein] reductase